MDSKRILDIEQEKTNEYRIGI